MTIMGGAVDFLGNSTPYSEFNFYNDPLAAHLVLNSGFPVTLVDLRAGSQVTITREQAAALKADNAIGRLVIEILNSWFQRDPLRERFNFDDPLALAVSLNPQLIATQTVTIEVEHTNTLRWGESRITTCSGNVALATTVDTQGFFTLLKELLGLQGLEV
jgi:purine nucleosidase